MAWSKCGIALGPTKDDDTMSDTLESVGTIKDKSSTLEATEGDTLEAKATGGETVASEDLEGDYILKTRVIEPDNALYTRLGLGAEDTTSQEFRTQTHVVEGDFSAEVTPKNVGAIGIRAPKCHVTFKPGWSEEDGNFADFELKILKGDAGYWYGRFKKPAPTKAATKTTASTKSE